MRNRSNENKLKIALKEAIKNNPLESKEPGVNFSVKDPYYPRFISRFFELEAPYVHVQVIRNGYFRSSNDPYDAAEVIAQWATKIADEVREKGFRSCSCLHVDTRVKTRVMEESTGKVNILNETHYVLFG